MIRLAWTNLWRRPLRTLLASTGVAFASATFLFTQGFLAGYQRHITLELSRMGIQMMLVPLGCPYDAAARVLKGNALESTLPLEALTRARDDPAVATAAPFLMAALPRPRENRTDMFCGMDESGAALKPWWRAPAGAGLFPSSDSVILGADAAAIEMRQPGDSFYSPELARQFQVAGVLERNGTSDDQLFFMPLSTAQELFHASNRVTAIAIRLKDPVLLREAAARLGEIPGAQVVTMTEMMGTFLSVLGTVRTFILAITWVALIASGLGVLTVLLSATVERTPEYSLLRALGASRPQVFTVVLVEAILLASLGVCVGAVSASLSGGWIEDLASGHVPFAESARLFQLSPRITAATLLAALLGATLTAIYPAWRASGNAPAAVLKQMA